MSDIFDYSTSPLNPSLKIVITMLFFMVTIIYYGASAKYGGEVQNFGAVKNFGVEKVQFYHSD